MADVLQPYLWAALTFQLARKGHFGAVNFKKMLNYPSSNSHGSPLLDLCASSCLKGIFFPTWSFPKHSQNTNHSAPPNTNSDKPPPGFENFWAFSAFLSILQGVLVAGVLTMRCWKSQERMMLVACLGRTPRLFLDFLSSPSRREVRSRFTCQDKRNEERIGWKWWWATQKMSKTNPEWEWDEWKKPGT